MDPSPMAALLADIATVVTQIMTWVSTIASTIVSTPLLLVTTGFLMIGKLHTADLKLGNIGKKLKIVNTEINMMIA